MTKVTLRTFWNGQPWNVNRRVKATVKRARKYGLVPTSTTNGAHSRGSWHYIVPGRNTAGAAVDLGFEADDLRRLGQAERTERLSRFQRAEYARARRYGFRGYLELIGPVNGLVILGGRPAGLAEGTALEQAHDDHVHVARP